MTSIASIFPLIFMFIIYIGIPAAIVVLIYFFYKLVKERNEELKKQNEILDRIANVLERSS